MKKKKKVWDPLKGKSSLFVYHEEFNLNFFHVRQFTLSCPSSVFLFFKVHDYLQKVYCWDNKSSSKLRDVALYMCGHMIKTALFTVKKDEGGLIVNLKYKHD